MTESLGCLVIVRENKIHFFPVGASSSDDTNNNTVATQKDESISIDDHNMLKKKTDELVEEGVRIYSVGPDPVRQHLVPAHFRAFGTQQENVRQYYDLTFLDPKLTSLDDPVPAAMELLVKSQENLPSCLREISYGVKNDVCTRDQPIEEDVVVRTRGLPWQATDLDMANFFVGLEIAPGGIALCLSSEGRRNGEALVRFKTVEMRTLALKRHRQFLLSRYIEVYKASSEEFLQIAAGSSSEAMTFVSSGAAVTIRMRGLPYDCSENQIKEFFLRQPGSCQVLDKMLFVTRNDGRPTGDAFVQFASEEEGQAALGKNRQTIGNRYIELFRSTPAEVQQVVKRSNEVSNTQAQRKECIRLRGLPYEAQVQNVVEFLGEHARNIQFQGVHMVFNSQGHPSGEAFIQMNSEQAAANAASSVHNKFMNIGKKQRYIEVFQCSSDDMNLMGPTNVGPPPQVPPMIMPPVQRPPFVPGVMPMWAYPSPPISPNYHLSGQVNQLIVYGITPNIGVPELFAQFTTPDTVVENVMFTRFPTAALPGEAVVSLRPRLPTEIDPQMFQKIPSDPAGQLAYPSRLFTVIQS